MGHYYIRGRKVEFDDSNPPAFKGGVVQLAPGVLPLVFNEVGIGWFSMLFFSDNLWQVDATIEQLNQLHESGKALFAEPNLLEQIGPRT